MKNKHNKNWSFIFLLTIFFGFSNYSNAQSNGFEVIKNMELLDLIYQHLDMYYVDEPQPGKMSKTGIDAMLRELDPYTVYYHENNIEDYRMITTGQYGGIGAIIRKIDDYSYIIEPREGKPAQLAGAKAGDKILTIEGKNMNDKSSEEVSDALKGPKGTTIDVGILRDGEKITLAITRDEIKIDDAPFTHMFDNSIGYIKLNSFMPQSTSADVKKAYTELKSQGMTSLIFDLRGNGGGLMLEAVSIVNMFVKKGQSVVTTRGRVEDENRDYRTTDAPMDLDIPIVVLVDENSASASEIVSGSLQDLDRAVIIGTTSFGKGLVQRTYDLKYGSKMKLTIAKYYTPSGRCVQRLEYYNKELGVRPQEIADSLVKKFKTVNGRDVIDGRGIEPDFTIDKNELSRLTSTLYVENILFNYATNYAKNNPTIPQADLFKLSDSEYEAFKTYALSKEFEYSTASEEMLKKMKETAEEEGYLEEGTVEYDALLAKVVPSKKRDLDKFKPEIKELLENEIVSRFYYQNGRIINSFNNDRFILKAIEVLQDNKKYNSTLKP